MIEIRYTKQFKKDLKKIQNKPDKISKLKVVLKLLETGAALPSEYKPHKLVGNFKGCMECHVENDTLLIWIDETQEEIKLLRLGSHTELFD